MGTPAATIGDRVNGTCMHTYQSTTPTPVGPVPSPVPMTLPFSGTIVMGCPTVLIGGKPAAVLNMPTVTNTAIHPPVGGAPTPGPATPVATNVATIVDGSPTVLIGGAPAIRTGSKTAAGECGLIAPAVVVGSAATVLIA
ncbi:MAG TPA: PAAR domain-containing protein [Chloroflexia bacterium]|nr:PAAR domain-containing protein [Chloroflexia bacterium]